jgi:hypothetical protein
MKVQEKCILIKKKDFLIKKKFFFRDALLKSKINSISLSFSKNYRVFLD